MDMISVATIAFMVGTVFGVWLGVKSRPPAPKHRSPKPHKPKRFFIGWR